MKFKRIMAVTLAAMTIAGTSVMALPVSAASSSSTSATSTKAKSTKYADSTYKTKLNQAKQTTAYKKAKTNMQRVALIANSQANLTFSSYEKAAKAYGVNGEWSGAFVKWCLKQGGYTPLKNLLYADPESLGVPANKTVFTYYGTKRLTDGACFSKSYIKGVKASNKNVPTAKINYKKGGILCFGFTYDPIDANKKLYYFAHCGIITTVSTYGDKKVVGYVCGNEGNNNKTVYHTFTINTKTGKVSGLGSRIIMSYSEY